jgi:hypothetical protein
MGPGTPQNQNERPSSNMNNDNISVMYKPTKTKKVGDKGLKISHYGLKIKQIILARVAEDYLLFMRQFSSSNLNKMKAYYKKGKKTFTRDLNKPIKAVSNVLVLVEQSEQTVIGKGCGYV